MQQKNEHTSTGTGKAAEKSKTFSVKNPAFLLAVALLLCFVGALGAGLTKTNGASVTVKQLRWETPSGLLQSAQLFIPPNAAPDTPAPAIVCAHGWMLNSEYQDEVYIEFSRRGYVVLSIDMYGHGSSDNVAANDWWKEDSDNGANGLYDGVQMLAGLPYVDSTRIGVTGNSNGATACNLAVMLDNQAAKPLISSVLLVVNEPITAKNQGLIGVISKEANDEYYNLYKNRNVGLVAVMHDEIFNRLILRDGTITSPRDFIQQPTAQSFLNFGRNPAGLAKRDSYTLYTEKIDGKDAIRVIYNPDMLHSWSFFSSRVVGSSVEFFEKAIPAPRPLASGNQVWQLKPFFSLIGMVGLFLFFVNFILMMLQTRFFNELQAREPVVPRVVSRKGKVWLWAGLSLGGLFAAIAYPVVFILGSVLQPKFFNQQQTYVLGVWSLCCGLFTLLILFLNYRRYARKSDLNLQERGVVLEKGKIPKTVLLGVLSAAATYGIVFLVGYFFNTDFHVWLFLGINTFDMSRLAEILKFLPFFLIFYGINSIAMNVFNYIHIGRKEWVNTLLMALFNILGVIILYAGIYGYFFATGSTPGDYLAWGLPSMIFWLLSMFIILPAATVISRIIYKATRNPYLPAIALSIMVTAMLCARTLTTLT